MKKHIVFPFILCMCMFLTSCGVKMTGVKIQNVGELTTGDRQSLVLDYEFNHDGSDKEKEKVIDKTQLIFSSDNMSVANIVGDGKTILAGTGGTATITVRSLDGTIHDSINVTVLARPKEFSIPHELTLTLGSEEVSTITPTVQPEDFDYSGCEYSSSNEGVVTVDQDGNLTPVSAGTASVYDVHAREVFLKYEKAVVEQGLGSMPIITAPETIAPNWMDFSHYNYAVIDDKFYTFAYISDTGYEKNVTAGWLNQFINSGEGVDVEIFLDRHTRDEVYSKIGFNVKQKRAKSLDSHDTDSDFHEIQNAIGAGSYLLDGLAAGEDLFYASVLFTITADDLTELERRFHEFEKNAKGSGYKVVRCDFRMQEAFMSSLPTCSLEKQLYKHSKRNVLTSGASSFYPFVSFEMQDPNGIMIGTNTANNSLVIIDVMDRNIHRNSNGAILGTSGSGKTFTSHLFALRFRMRRIQTFILAPVKGERDYGNGCYRVGGQFVSMSPGSPNHINIMDIHAPDLSNIDSLGDDDASNARKRQASNCSKRRSCKTGSSTGRRKTENPEFNNICVG